MSAIASRVCGSAANQVRPPSLHNQSFVQWERAGQIAFLFARHARHDMANVHCGLNLIDVVDAIQKQCPGEPLPEELQPERLQVKIRNDLKQLMSISNDLVLLSQSASRAAYRGARIEPLANVLSDAILTRLGTQTIPPGLGGEELQSLQVIALGDMLEAALATFFFQWTPCCQPLDHVLHATASGRIEQTQTVAECVFPLEKQTLNESAVERLQALDPWQPLPEIDNELTASTTELALWLARNIVLIHGGTIGITRLDGLRCLHVRLPVVG